MQKSVLTFKFNYPGIIRQLQPSNTQYESPQLHTALVQQEDTNRNLVFDDEEFPLCQDFQYDASVMKYLKQNQPLLQNYKKIMTKQELDKSIDSMAFKSYQAKDFPDINNITSFQDALLQLVNTQIFIPAPTNKLSLVIVPYGTFIGKDLEYSHYSQRVDLQRVINGNIGKVTNQNLIKYQLEIQKKFNFSSPDALMHNLLIQMASKYYNGKTYFVNSIRASVLASMLQESRLMLKQNQDIYKQFLSHYGINELWQACKISATQILGQTQDAIKIEKLQKQTMLGQEQEQNQNSVEEEILTQAKQHQQLLKFNKQNIAFGQFEIHQQNQDKTILQLGQNTVNIQVQQRNQIHAMNPYQNSQRLRNNYQQNSNHIKIANLQNYQTINYHQFLVKCYTNQQQQVQEEQQLLQQYNEVVPQLFKQVLNQFQNQNSLGQIIVKQCAQYLLQSFKQYNQENIQQFKCSMAEDDFLRPIYFNVLISNYNHLDSIISPLVQPKIEIDSQINMMLCQSVLGFDNILYNKLYLQNQMNLIDGIPSLYAPFACTSLFAQVILDYFKEIDQKLIINDLNQSYFSDSLLMLQATCYFNLTSENKIQQKNWFKFDDITQIYPQLIHSNDQIIAGCNMWPTFEQIEDVKSQDILQNQSPIKEEAVSFIQYKEAVKYYKKSDEQQTMQFLEHQAQFVQQSKVGFKVKQNQVLQLQKIKDSNDYVIEKRELGDDEIDTVTHGHIVSLSINSNCFDKNQYYWLNLQKNKVKIQLAVPQCIMQGIRSLSDLVKLSESHQSAINTIKLKCFEQIVQGNEICPALVYNQANDTFAYYSAIPDNIQKYNQIDIGNYMQYCLNQYLQVAGMSESNIYDQSKYVTFTFVQFFKESQLAQRQIIILKDDFDSIEVFIGYCINQELMQGKYESLMRQVCNVNEDVPFQIGFQNVDGTQIETNINAQVEIEQYCQQNKMDIYRFLEQKQDQIYKKLKPLQRQKVFINKSNIFGKQKHQSQNEVLQCQHIKQINYQQIQKHKVKQDQPCYKMTFKNFCQSLQVLKDNVNFEQLDQMSTENQISLVRISTMQILDQLIKRKITICDIQDFGGQEELKEIVKSKQYFRFTTKVLKNALEQHKQLPLFSIVSPAILAGQQPLLNIFGQTICQKLNIYQLLNKQQLQQLYVQPQPPTEAPPQPQAASEDVSSQQLIDFWIQLRNKYYSIDNYTIQALRSPLFCLEGRPLMIENDKIIVKESRSRSKNSIFNMASYQQQIYNINPYWIPQQTTYEAERLSYYILLNEQIVRLISKPIKQLINKISYSSYDKIVEIEAYELLINANYKFSNQAVASRLYQQLMKNYQDVIPYDTIIKLDIQNPNPEQNKKQVTNLVNSLLKDSSDLKYSLMHLSQNQKIHIYRYLQQLQSQLPILDIHFYGQYTDETYPAPIEPTQFLMQQVDLHIDKQAAQRIMNRHKLLINQMKKLEDKKNVNEIFDDLEQQNDPEYKDLLYTKLIQEQNKLKIIEQQNMEANVELSLKLETLKNEDLQNERNELFNTAAIALFANYKQRQKPVYQGKIASDQLALGAYETVEETTDEKDSMRKAEQSFKDFEKLYHYAEQNNISYGNPQVIQFKNGKNLSQDDIISWD